MFIRCVSDSHEDNANINIPAAHGAGHSTLFVVLSSGEKVFCAICTSGWFGGRGRVQVEWTTKSLQVITHVVFISAILAGSSL